MPDAMSAYSIAVAPDSSRRKRVISLYMHRPQRCPDGEFTGGYLPHC
jgi:hypothetical protein